MTVSYVRLIVSIAFTVVSVTFLFVAVAGAGRADELSYPYLGVMFFVGGLLALCRNGR